ncbi:MAG: hypothetical protein J1E95_01545 [Muribaculaceae bacterium]|nr:hypothetical protein [Muribaculaceae bacterium]
MDNFKSILAIVIERINTVGSLLLILILFFASPPFTEVIPEWNWFVSLGIFIAVILVMKYLFGGWNAKSISGMIWSCVMSSIGGVGLALYGMKVGEGSISLLVACLPIIIGAIFGIWSAHWVEKLLSDEYAQGLTAENILGSVFDNGIKGTWNAFMGDIMGNAYVAYGRGVAVYANLCILTGVIIFLIYR